MIVPPLNQAPLILPSPDPVPTVGGQVFPPAKTNSSANHVQGVVIGRDMAYSDVQAGAWYTGKAGRDLRGAGRLSRRGLSGIEDTANVKR